MKTVYEYTCQCRYCDKRYEARKARGEYKGFCSSKCQHARAKELGYSKSRHKGEHQVLKGQCGDYRPRGSHRDPTGVVTPVQLDYDADQKRWCYWLHGKASEFIYRAPDDAYSYACRLLDEEYLRKH